MNKEQYDREKARKRRKYYKEQWNKCIHENKINPNFRHTKKGMVWAAKQHGPVNRILDTTHDFYNSRAWKEIRFSVLNEHGRVCVSCGAHGQGVVLHVDHIVPRSINPSLSLDKTNLQVLCEACNIGKGATVWKPKS